MDVSIENPEGSRRRPQWPALKSHYGYIRGTVGFDKDHVDVFVKPGTTEDFNGAVYVVNQQKADGKFDEHKVMIGFDSEASARAGYLENYSKGWKGGDSIVAMPMEDFKTWAYDKSEKGPKGGALKAVATLPAKRQQLFVQRGKERFEVASFEDAAKLWDKFRDTTGAGASEIGDGATIVDQDGKTVAHISYNGKVWAGEPGNWKPGTKPLVGENFKSNLPADRRKDSAQRQRVADMAPEEMQRALLTDTLTGLGNRRAYDEAEKLPVQVSIDLDSLKWVNDNFGHAAGDALIEAMGQAVREETAGGYHLSGDEFALQADTAAAARTAVEAVQKRLAGAELTFKLPDGSTVTKKGVDFSYGIAATLEEADAALLTHKGEREAAGQRAGRGEPPPGITRRPAQGQPSGERQAPSKAKVAAEPGKLEDVGEKIGGARKDWRGRGLILDDLEGMTGGEESQNVIKQNIWKPDYVAMVKAGAEPEAAASVKVMYDNLAAQPKKDTPEERRRYLATMVKVRAAYEGVKTAPDFKAAREVLMKDLGVENTAWWKSDEFAKSGLFTVYRGRREPFQLNYKQRSRAAQLVADGFPGETQKRAARADGDGKEEPKRPHLDHLEREGKARRKGDKNVSAEDFMKAFSFRGVEFGNWAANDERQKHVNQAFDALSDLAEVLGIPPSAISLNGTLGIAFGARGSGKAAAHYEPGKLVINITKVNGPGTLAHEWGHAVDHYFGELDRDDAYAGRARGASGWYTRPKFDMPGQRLQNLRPEMAEAFDQVMKAFFKKDITKAEQVRKIELALERQQGELARNEERLAKAGDEKWFRDQMKRTIDGTKANIDSLGEQLTKARGAPADAVFGKAESSYYANAKALSGKSGETGYWARPTELFARAFEAYVFDKLARSDYLVHGVEAERYASPAYKGNPYPTGLERTAISKAFDNLFEKMETRDTPKGTALFKRAGATTSASFKKWFGASKVVDEAGRPKVVYHGTNADFSEFGFTDDIGFHFGNQEAAQARITQGELADGANVMPVYLRIENPLRLPDLYTWDSDNVAGALQRAGVLTSKQAEKFAEFNDRETVKEALAKKGYDGIVYRNAVEGKRRLQAGEQIDLTFHRNPWLGKGAGPEKAIMARTADGGDIGYGRTKEEARADAEKYLRRGKRMPSGDSYIAFDPEQIKSAIGNRGTFDRSEGDIRFARGARAGEGQSIDDVQKQAEQLTQHWVNAPEVQVLSSPAVAPFEAPRDALGAYWNGTMYLFARNLRSAEQVQYTVLHEVMGHRGLRGFFGNDLDPVLRDLAMRNKNLRAAAAEWKSVNPKADDMSAAEHEALSIEEALADLAGQGKSIDGLGKLLAAVQRWLRAHGFDKVADWLEQLGDAEALSVLAAARAYVVGEPAGAPTFTQTAPAFARDEESKKTFAEAIRDRVTGKTDPRDTLHVSDTPPVMMLLGMRQHRVVLGGSTLDKVLYDHGVPMTMVQRIPELLKDPVMVFESDTVPGDFVVVTTEKFQDKPLMITLRPDGDMNREVVNVITSVYPRNKPGEAFNRWIKGDLLTYLDQAKRPGWQRSLGLQLPGKMPSRGAGKKLLSESDLVKATGGANPDTKEGPAPAFARASAPGAQAAQLQKAKQATYTRIANAIIDRIDTALDPILGLPDRDAYLKMRYLAQGSIDNANDIARGIYDTFSTATDADTKAAYEYLTTKDAKADVIKDKAVRDHAVKTKEMIDQVGQGLVKRGLLSEETFEEHRGAYLPRIYLKHLLEGGDFARIGGGRKPSKMGYLKQRKDIPAEVRAVLLGEIKDPGYLASVGFARATRDMAIIDWLARISGNGKWVLPKGLIEHNGHKVTPFWLKSEAERLRDQAEHQDAPTAAKARAAAAAMDKAAAPALKDLEFDEKEWKQIPDTARYGRLRGLVVRREIFDDIVGIGAAVPSDAGWAEKWLGYGGYGTKATQLWKASKVSLNPPSQVRNWVSNAMLLHLSGVPLHMVPVRLAQAAKAIRTNGPAWEIAKKGGIKANTFSATELTRIETAMLDLKAKESGKMLARLAAIAGKGFNAAGDIYQFSESLFKTAKIVDELAKKTGAGDAVLEANKWLFDYSRVAPSVRYLRNAPIGAPFLTFMVKVAPRLMEVGLKHPQRYAPYVIAAYAIPMLVASMLGVDQKDLDKLKKLLPESWQTKGHVYVLPWKDQYGRWQVLDLSYFMPWAQFDQAARQLVKGDIVGMTKSLGLFGGPIPDIITAWKTNKDPFSGRDIVSKGASPALQLGALLTYAMNIALPPWLTSNGLLGVDLGDPAGFLSGKIPSAIEGKTNRYGDAVTTPVQAALSTVGVNMRSVDPQTDRARVLQQAQRGIADVRSELKHKLEDRALSDDQKARVKGIYVDEAKRRTEKLRELARDTDLPPALR